MKPIAALALASLLTLNAAAAAAQEGRPADQEFVFRDGADVGGTRTGPVGEQLTVPRREARHSLIRIRTEFVSAIERSADGL